MKWSFASFSDTSRTRASLEEDGGREGGRERERGEEIGRERRGRGRGCRKGDEVHVHVGRGGREGNRRGRERK